MKKTFEQSFPGAGIQQMEAYWNEKSYNGVRYVNVKRVGDRSRGTDMTWVDGQGWSKNGGHVYADKVADLLGFK